MKQIKLEVDMQLTTTESWMGTAIHQGLGRGQSPVSNRGITMKEQTRVIIRTLLEGDETVTAEVKKAILSAMNGTEKKRRMIVKKEVARILGCHPASVCRYVKRGHIHPVRLSCRKVRYCADEIESLAAVGVQNPSSAA